MPIRWNLGSWCFLSTSSSCQWTCPVIFCTSIHHSTAECGHPKRQIADKKPKEKKIVEKPRREDALPPFGMPGSSHRCHRRQGCRELRWGARSSRCGPPVPRRPGVTTEERWVDTGNERGRHQCESTPGPQSHKDQQKKSAEKWPGAQVAAYMMKGGGCGGGAPAVRLCCWGH